MNDAYRALFATVRRRPGMYSVSHRYDVVVAFVAGCDIGNNGGLLRGFEEWLLQRGGGRRNHGWRHLVLERAFPENHEFDVTHFTDEEHRRATEALWELLDEFLSQSGTLLDTRRIYHGYWRWQEEQGLRPT